MASKDPVLYFINLKKCIDNKSNVNSSFKKSFLNVTK